MKLGHTLHRLAHTLLSGLGLVCLLVFIALNPVQVIRAGLRVLGAVGDMVENVASGRYRGR